MKRKVMSLLLVCCMLLSCLAGCGKQPVDQPTDAPKTTDAPKATDAPAETDAPTEAVPAEPITITIASSSLGNMFPESDEANWFRQILFEKTNVWVDLVLIDDYYTALNVQLTGGQAPDFFPVDYDHMKEYADQGLIQPINQYKESFAPMLEWLGEEYDNFVLYVEDEMYAFPRAEANSDLYELYFIRQDVLDHYGMEMPKTIDEFFDFCQKSVKDDVTGLQTMGIGAKKFAGYNMIAGTYGVMLGNYVIIKDGEVTNTLLDPNMKDALTAVKKFQDAGLVSPNIWDKGTAVVEMRKGQTVAGSAPWSNLLKQSYIDVLHAVNPDAEWGFIPAFESNVEGVESYAAFYDYNSNSGNKFVVNADTSEEKINAFIKVLNYIATDEGKMLTWLGVQGTHWDYDANGNAVVLEGQAEAINYTSNYQFAGRNDDEYLAVKFPEAAEANEFRSHYNRLLKYNNVLDVPTDLYLEDMEAYVQDQLIAFIQGERPIEEYDAFVQELYDIYNFGAYMDLAAEQLIARGLANK